MISLTCFSISPKGINADFFPFPVYCPFTVFDGFVKYEGFPAILPWQTAHRQASPRYPDRDFFLSPQSRFFPTLSDPPSRFPLLGVRFDAYSFR